MGRVLGAHTHSLGLIGFDGTTGTSWRPLGEQLLDALSLFTVMLLSPSSHQVTLDPQNSAFVAFVTACQEAQRRVELQLLEGKFTEGEAGGLANEWETLVRI